MGQYFCRLCYSTNNWIQPSQLSPAIETKSSHYGNFGFCYEEWNFSNALIFNGFQYGWIEAFESKQGRLHIPPGLHRIAFYVRDRGASYFVGKLDCTKLNVNGRIQYPANLPALPGNVIATGGQWAVNPIVVNPGMYGYVVPAPSANMRFQTTNPSLPHWIKLNNWSHTRYGARHIANNSNLLALWNSLP